MDANTVALLAHWLFEAFAGKQGRWMRLGEDPIGQAMMVMGVCSGLVGGVVSIALVPNPYYALILVPVLWGALYALVAILLRLLKSLVLRRWGGSEKGQKIWYRFVVPLIIACGVIVGIASMWVLAKSLVFPVSPKGLLVFVGISIESILLTFYSVAFTRKD